MSWRLTNHFVATSSCIPLHNLIASHPCPPQYQFTESLPDRTEWWQRFACWTIRQNAALLRSIRPGQARSFRTIGQASTIPGLSIEFLSLPLSVARWISSNSIMATWSLCALLTRSKHETELSGRIGVKMPRTIFHRTLKEPQTWGAL